MSRSSRLPWLALVLFAPASPGVATAQFIDADVKMVKILDKLAADDKYPLRYDAPGAKQLRDQHRRWHLVGTLGVFDKGPNAKAAWAPQARVVFEQYAQCMTQTDLCGNPRPSATPWPRRRPRRRSPPGATTRSCGTGPSSTRRGSADPTPRCSPGSGRRWPRWTAARTRTGAS